MTVTRAAAPGQAHWDAYMHQQAAQISNSRTHPASQYRTRQGCPLDCICLLKQKAAQISQQSIPTRLHSKADERNHGCGKPLPSRGSKHQRCRRTFCLGICADARILCS